MKLAPLLLLAAFASVSVPASAGDGATKPARKAAKKAAKPEPRKSAVLRLGKANLKVDISDNDSLRTLGLSNRRSMDWNEGMLFVFPDATARTFWMIDCWFDLDIAYLDRKGTVRDIQTMRIEPGVAPELLARYPSATADVVYALETNRGWMAANGIKVGDRFPQIAAFKAKR